MLRLKRPLRRTSNADPKDVLGVKRQLAGLGFYEPPTGELHEYPDAELFAAVADFQKASGETPDGEMLPGGPTEAALNAIDGQRAAPSKFHANARIPGRARAEPPDDLHIAAPAGQKDVGEAEAEGSLQMAAPPRRTRPVNRSRCLDSCEAGGKVLRGFCRALRSKVAREACWRMTNEGVTACRNWCHNQFDQPDDLRLSPDEPQ